MATKEKIKVSQHQLRRYKELEALVAEYKALKNVLMHAALNNPDIQKGPLGMQVKMNKGRRTPAWKTLATGLAEKFKDALAVVSGDAWAEKVIEDTKPGPDTKSLVVYDSRESVV